MIRLRRITAYLSFGFCAALVCGCEKWMITDRNIPAPRRLVLDGDYQYEDGSTNWGLLVLREDGTFREYGYGCFRSAVERDGVFELRGDILILRTTKWYHERRRPASLERLKVVRESARTCLLPEATWKKLEEARSSNPRAPIPSLGVWKSVPPLPSRYKPRPRE